MREGETDHGSVSTSVYSAGVAGVSSDVGAASRPSAARRSWMRRSISAWSRIAPSLSDFTIPSTRRWASALKGLWYCPMPPGGYMSVECDSEGSSGSSMGFFMYMGGEGCYRAGAAVLSGAAGASEGTAPSWRLT